MLIAMYGMYDKREGEINVKRRFIAEMAAHY